MSKLIKIASWNLCLGLQNKKYYVDFKLNKENVDNCCLQECQIPINLDEKTLTKKETYMYPNSQQDKL